MEKNIQIVDEGSLEQSKIIGSINLLINDIINENLTSINGAKIKLLEAQKLTPFYSKSEPSITVSAYLERIIKYSKMELATLVVALIYIDVLCEKSKFLLTSNNIHR